MTDRLDQQQQTENPDDVLRAYVDSRLKDLHTMVPGIIESYDPGSQTARVQPAIQRIFTEKGPVNLPVCVDVIVQFPSGGDFVMTFPVAAGDECILGFFERAIDRWFAYGGTQPPAEYRLHDLSDGVAIVGIRSQPRKLTNVQTTGAELRTVDRSTYFRLEEGGIYIKGNIFHEGSTMQSGSTISTGSISAGEQVVAPLVQGTTDVKFGNTSAGAHRHKENNVLHGETDPPTATPPPPED